MPPPRSRSAGPVRLVDIAQRVGVDKSTVSLALRGDPRISAATRDQVRAEAERLGYRSNAIFTLLAARRWGTGATAAMPNAGLVLPARGVLPRKITLLTAGACQRATTVGMNLDVLHAEDHGDPRRLADVLRSRGTHGVIIGPSDRPFDWTGFPWKEFSAVAVVGGNGLPPLVTVRPAAFSDVLLAHEKVAAAVGRPVGLALAYNRWTAIDERRLAAAHFCQHYAVQGAPSFPPYIVEHHVLGSDRAAALAALCAWWGRHRPRGVICSEALLADTVAREAEKMGASVLTAVLDKSPRRDQRLPGIVDDYESLGQYAVDALMDLLRHQETGLPSLPRTISVPGLWTPGAAPLP